MLTGGCFCGRVRYEARGPAFNRTSCHCEVDGARDEIDVTRLEWVKLADGLPQFRESREEG